MLKNLGPISKINCSVFISILWFSSSCSNSKNLGYLDLCYANAISYLERAISLEPISENRPDQVSLLIAEKFIVPAYLGFGGILNCKEIGFKIPIEFSNGSEACSTFYLNELLEKYQRHDNYRLPASMLSHNDSLTLSEERLKLYFSELQNEHLYGIVVAPSEVTFESSYTIDFSGEGVEFLFKFDSAGRIDWVYKRRFQSH